MSEFTSWFNLFLFGLAVVIVLVWYRRNRRLLTIEERRRASDLTQQAEWSRLRNFSTILVVASAVVLLFVLEKVFNFENALSLISFFIWFDLCRSMLRNGRIYRQAELPQKFIRAEKALGVFTLSMYGLLIIYILVT